MTADKALEKQPADIYRRKIEELQREVTLEKEKARKYLDIAGVMFVALDPSGKITLLNKKACEILGCRESESEFIGRDWFDHFLPEDQIEPVRKVFKKLMAGKTKSAQFYENPVRTRDGHQRIIAWHNTVLKEKDGRISGLLSSGLDITERKKAEEIIINANRDLEAKVKERTRELQQSEEKFKKLAEKSLVGIFIIQKRRLKYANPAFGQIFGSPLKQLLNQPFLNLVHPGDKAKIKKKMMDLEEGEIRYSHFQFRGAARKQAGVFLEVYKARITYLDQPAIIGTLINITKRIEDEAALREKSRQLQELNADLENTIKAELKKRTQQERMIMQQAKLAAMGDLVGAIAHQWRQPLTTIGLIVQNLKVAYEVDKFSKEMLDSASEDAMKQINYLSRTIDDFRNFYRPAKEKEVFSVLVALQETADLIRPRLGSGNIDLALDYQKNKKYDVYGYPNEFKQVLINITNNAREAINSGRKAGKSNADRGMITIKLSKTAGKVRIRISNNGIKIKAGIMPRIFEPYFTTREAGEGMGIGLYMSKMIIEKQLQGSISAHNTPAGVDFIIELPKIKR